MNLTDRVNDVIKRIEGRKTKINEKVRKVERKVESLKNEMSELRERLVTADIEDKQSVVEELNDKLKNKRIELEELKDQLKTYKGVVVTGNFINKELRQELKEALDEDISDRVKKKMELRKEVNQKKEKINELEKERDSLQRELSNLDTHSGYEDIARMYSKLDGTPDSISFLNRHEKREVVEKFLNGEDTSDLFPGQQTQEKNNIINVNPEPKEIQTHQKKNTEDKGETHIMPTRPNEDSLGINKSVEVR